MKPCNCAWLVQYKNILSSNLVCNKSKTYYLRSRDQPGSSLSATSTASLNSGPWHGHPSSAVTPALGASK